MTLEAIFFIDQPSRAIGVASSSNLAVDAACESLRLDSPAPLLALSRLLRPGARAAVAPLRDATCQSFPVWVFETEACAALADANAETIDRIGDQWWEGLGREEVDADAYELTQRLEQLQAELRVAEPDARLLVLLEQKAI